MFCCYYCSKEHRAGGTHLGVKAAVGVCHSCGVALCLEHATRDLLSGALECLVHAEPSLEVPELVQAPLR